MCGHVGLFTFESTYSIGRRNYIEQGLFVDQLRGDDATGIALVTYEKKQVYYSLHKMSVPASVFLGLKRTDKFLNRNFASANIVIGHNRKATKGSLDDDTAHPFVNGQTILAHNGTVNWSSGTLSHKLSDFDVDSEFLSCSIDADGVDKTLASVTGSFALVWADMTKRTLNMIRNDERELWFAFIKDQDTMIYSSEKYMLRMLAERNKMELEENKVWELMPGHLLTFTSPKEYTSRAVKFYEAPKIQNTYGRFNNHSVTVYKGSEEILNSLGITRGSKLIIEVDAIGRAGSYVDAKNAYYNTTGFRLFGSNASFIQKNSDVNTFTGIVERAFNAGNKNFVELIEPCVYKKSSQSPLGEDKEDVGTAQEVDIYTGPYNSVMTKIELESLLKRAPFSMSCTWCTDSFSESDYGDIHFLGQDPICKHCLEHTPELIDMIREESKSNVIRLNNKGTKH